MAEVVCDLCGCGY